jgi:glycosyltransferase involved in cell wall biosynthesis
MNTEITKILIVVDSYSRGGAQAILNNLIQNWMSTSITVEIVIIRNSDKEFDLEALKSQGLIIHRLNATRMIDLKKWRKLINIVINSKPNIIFAHLFWSQIWCGMINFKRKKFRLVFVEHNTYLNRSRIQWFLYKLISIKVEKIIAVSHEVKFYLLNRVFCDIVVIYNPVILNEIGVSRKLSNPSFIFVGRLNHQKNPMLALKSFEYAINKNLIPIKSQLSFAGEGPYIHQLKGYVHQKNLVDNIKFLGFLNDYSLAKLYETSMTLVSTSIMEGFSLVRVEALIRGCSIVTTKTSGITGVLTKSNRTNDLLPGVFVVNNEIGEIANAMKESLRKIYWTKSQINCRKNAYKKFDIDLIAKKYLVSE